MTGSRRDGFVLVHVVRPGGVPSTPLFGFASGTRSICID